MLAEIYDKMQRKRAGVFSKQRFGFAGETTTEKLKKKIQKPKHSKEYVFLAECMGDVTQTEKYCQQNRGKRARKTKQAT